MLFILLSLLLQADSTLYKGYQDGFYSLEEIRNITKSFIDDWQQISALETKESLEVKNSLRYSQNFIPSDYKRTKVLIIGGFSSGFPISASQVLYNLDSLLTFCRSDKPNPVICDSLIIDFIPVINTEAYLRTSELFSTHKNFSVFLTDLSQKSEDCNKIDAGTNPDYNFKYQWANNSNSCSDVNPGKYPLESPVAALVSGLGNYDFVFNYQHSELGDAVFTPFKSGKEKLGNREKVYEIIKQNLPSGYKFGSFFDLTKVSNKGSYLDSSFTSAISSLALEISIGSKSAMSEYELSNQNRKNFDFFLQTLATVYKSLNILFVQVKELQSPSQNYSSIASFIFEADNSSPQEYAIDLSAVFYFSNSSQFIYFQTIFGIEYQDSGLRSNFSELTGTEAQGIIKVRLIVPAYSFASIDFRFYMLEKDAELTTEFKLNADPMNGELYFASRSFQGSTLVESSTPKESNSARTGIVIGLFLFFLFAIYCAIICCAFQRKNPFEKLNMDSL